MTASPAVATALTFVWFGMVLGISFLETPLKFRADGVTLEVGLGIGRVVFRALNTVEAVLAAALLVAALVPGRSDWPVLAVPVAVLAVQLALVRPRLTHHSDRVLTHENPPRSRAHHLYVVLETAKVLALLAAGIRLLAS